MTASCKETVANAPTGYVVQAQFIGMQVCQLRENRQEVAAGIIRNNWYNQTQPQEYLLRLGLVLLNCLTSDELSRPDRDRLNQSILNSTNPSALGGVPISPLIFAVD
jgi:hypothetical protein